MDEHTPVVTRHDDGTLSMEWPSDDLLTTPVSREVLQVLIDQLNEKTIELAKRRPWRFLPGDKVIVLLGNKVEGGTVTQIRIHGPVRHDHVVQVELDEVPFQGLSKSLWFHPDQVEPLRG